MSYRNVSTADRVLRIALGIGMLALGWSGVVGGLPALALQIFGLVPLVTGFIGWCPFYAFLGIGTNRTGPEKGSG